MTTQTCPFTPVLTHLSLHTCPLTSVPTHLFLHTCPLIPVLTHLPSHICPLRYQLMTLCWSLEPTDRPTFKIIGQLINRLLPSTKDTSPHYSDKVRINENTCPHFIWQALKTEFNSRYLNTSFIFFCPQLYRNIDECGEEEEEEEVRGGDALKRGEEERRQRGN